MWIIFFKGVLAFVNLDNDFNFIYIYITLYVRYLYFFGHLFLKIKKINLHPDNLKIILYYGKKIIFVSLLVQLFYTLGANSIQ
jgi:hypothetical protein